MNTESISPTNHYLQKIKQAQLLSAEQEVELAQTIEAGREAWGLLQQLGAPATANQVELEPPATDSVKSAAPTSSRSELEKKFLDGLAARQEFIVKNLRLVVSFASNYRPTSTLGMDDLIQEGNIGLQRAVDKFDWRRGFKFSTSATWWIRQAIQRLIETEGQGPAHVSTKAAAYVRDYRAAEQSLARAGQPISDDAIQQKCRLNLGQIKQAKAAIAIKNPLSLEWSSTSDRPNENTLGDTIMDPDSEVDLQRLLDQEQVESLLKNTPMSDRQRDIVGSTYGVAGYKLTTQEELAKRYGVSTTKIRTERIFAEQAIRNTQNGNLHSL